MRRLARPARDIIGHDVKTARQMGWATIKNGVLLALAGGQFEVFVAAIESARPGAAAYIDAD
jgi:hypothetical protein